MLIEKYHGLHLAQLKTKEGLIFLALGETCQKAMEDCFQKYNDYMLDKIINNL